MKTALIIALIIVGAAATQAFGSDLMYFNVFKAWLHENKKVYSHDEFAYRLSVFRENADKIATSNAMVTSFQLGMNQFGDMTADEFASMMLLKPAEETDDSHRAWFTEEETLSVPDAVDWVAKGAVTPIKDQGQCGSCWAFSSTGAIEGAEAVFKGNLVSLSEQQLVDCSGAYGNEGCNGGLMDQAFQYVEANHGLCSEADYPYVAYDQDCAADKCTSVPESAIKAHKDVVKNNEVQLKAACAQQPIAVAVEADQSGWQFYKSGVFDGNCGTALDHGVLLVGYGKDAPTGKLFWRIKNSWGTSWGDHGYIRIVRKEKSGGPGQCGVAMMASYPTY